MSEQPISLEQFRQSASDVTIGDLVSDNSSSPTPADQHAELYGTDQRVLAYYADRDQPIGFINIDFDADADEVIYRLHIANREWLAMDRDGLDSLEAILFQDRVQEDVFPIDESERFWVDPDLDQTSSPGLG